MITVTTSTDQRQMPGVAFICDAVHMRVRGLECVAWLEDIDAAQKDTNPTTTRLGSLSKACCCKPKTSLLLPGH